MKKIFLILFIGLLFNNYLYSQRKTTSVKGYYRKNGTYVRPHTRTYNSSSSSSTSGGSYYYSSSTKEDVKIEPTTLSFVNSDSTDVGDKKKKKNSRNNTEVKASSLDIVDEDSREGVVFYVSVLRYNGKAIDICPIKRNYSDEWDFDDVKHVINKNDLSTEHALDLVSNYSWTIKGDKMTKSFYSFNKKEFPDYLTKDIEAIKVQ